MVMASDSRRELPPLLSLSLSLPLPQRSCELRLDWPWHTSACIFLLNSGSLLVAGKFQHDFNTALWMRYEIYLNFLVASWCLFSSKFSRGCAEIPEISSSSAVFEHCCRFLEFDYAGVIFPVHTFGFAIFVWEESGFSFHTICFVSFLVRFSSTSLLYTVLVCPAHGCANSGIFSFWNWQKENVESKSLWLHSRESSQVPYLCLNLVLGMLFSSPNILLGLRCVVALGCLRNGGPAG
jgi:hypothetical protein